MPQKSNLSSVPGMVFGSIVSRTWFVNTPHGVSDIVCMVDTKFFVSVGKVEWQHVAPPTDPLRKWCWSKNDVIIQQYSLGKLTTSTEKGTKSRVPSGDSII